MPFLGSVYWDSASLADASRTERLANHSHEARRVRAFYFLRCGEIRDCDGVARETIAHKHNLPVAKVEPLVKKIYDEDEGDEPFFGKERPPLQLKHRPKKKRAKAKPKQAPTRKAEAAKKLAEVSARMVERLAHFREMARDRRNVPVLRQLLRHALRIHDLNLVPTIEDGRKTYAINGKAWVSTRPIRREQLASPRGFEPRLPP